MRGAAAPGTATRADAPTTLPGAHAAAGRSEGPTRGTASGLGPATAPAPAVAPFAASRTTPVAAPAGVRRKTLPPSVGSVEPLAPSFAAAPAPQPHAFGATLVRMAPAGEKAMPELRPASPLPAPPAPPPAPPHTVAVPAGAPALTNLTLFAALVGALVLAVPCLTAAARLGQSVPVPTALRLSLERPG